MLSIYISNIKNLRDPIDDLDILGVLPEYRKNKILRLPNALSRKQSLGAGLLLNKILNKYNINHTDISFNEYDKPLVDNLYFNLSHSKDYVICVISDKQVGCDIEKIKKANKKLAERFFNRDELLFLNNSNNYDLDFYRLWTIKESYIKMLGKGLSIPLNSFRVRLNEKKIDDKNNILTTYINEIKYDDYQIAVSSLDNSKISDLIHVKLDR